MEKSAAPRPTSQGLWGLQGLQGLEGKPGCPSARTSQTRFTSLVWTCLGSYWSL